MDGATRCQSCGMPLDVGVFGTNADGTVNGKYCKYCFERGEFREPNLTLDEMLGRSVANMIDDSGMEREEAEKLAQDIIPNLERWRHK